MSQFHRRLIVSALALLLLAAVPAAALGSPERTTSWTSILDLASRLWSQLSPWSPLGSGDRPDGGLSVVWGEEGASLDPDGRSGAVTPPSSAPNAGQGQ